jgi:hypothetical protein
MRNVTVTLSMPIEMKEIIAEAARAEDRTISSFVRNRITKILPIPADDKTPTPVQPENYLPCNE